MLRRGSQCQCGSPLSDADKIRPDRQSVDELKIGRLKKTTKKNKDRGKGAADGLGETHEGSREFCCEGKNRLVGGNRWGGVGWWVG